MNTRPKSSGFKSLEEILAEKIEETPEAEDLSQAGQETKIMQSSPLDDAFDAHTVIRPMASYPPPPKPVPAPPPVQAPKPSVAKSEEKPPPPPKPARSEAAIPIDIPRPPQVVSMSDETNPRILKPHVSKPIPERVETQQAKKETPAFDAKKMSKPVADEPSSIGEGTGSSYSGHFSQQTQSGLAVSKSSGTQTGILHQTNITHDSEITGISEVTSTHSERPWSRIPKRLVISVAAFVLAIGFWLTTRNSGKGADTVSETKSSSHEVEAHSPSDNVAGHGAPPIGVAVHPTVTPPPVLQAPASDSVLSSFDRAFTKTQDQARYSTNRL